MNEENTNELSLQEQEESQPDLTETATAVKQVEEIKEVFTETVTETSLPDKMSDLRTTLETLSEEVDSWRAWRKNDYLAAIETLKTQLDDVQTEWDNVSDVMKKQSEKLESLLQSFPGVIETATLKTLSLRVSHLEQLVSQVFSESQTKIALKGSKKQYIISLVALGVTIILWAVFITMNLIK